MALNPFCYDDRTIRTAGTVENPLFCLGDVCDTLDVASSRVKAAKLDDKVAVHTKADKG